MVSIFKEFMLSLKIDRGEHQALSNSHVFIISILLNILNFTQAIVVGELICRGAKHLFKTYMQGVDMMSLSSAVSHFLNCFIGSYPNPHAQVTAEEVG